jgi:predicted RNase H-like HicB family nuclease
MVDMSSREIECIVQIWQEGEQYVAHAMPLDVMSSGHTADEARRALDEAVRLFLDTAAEAGTLDDVLAECGYLQTDGNWVSPTWVSTEKHSLRLVA